MAQSQSLNGPPVACKGERISRIDIDANLHRVTGGLGESELSETENDQKCDGRELEHGQSLPPTSKATTRQTAARQNYTLTVSAHPPFDAPSALCYGERPMIHEHLSKSIEDLSARMIVIRDSL